MNPTARFLYGALSALVLSGISFSQQPAVENSKHVNLPTIAPRTEDVATIDRIMKAFYEVISGPAGQPRQWSRDRTLYIADTRFVALSEEKTDSRKLRSPAISNSSIMPIRFS